MNRKNNIAAVILAAGHGTRMKSELPKVMHRLDGKPLIEHVIETVEDSKACDRCVVVVSPLHTFVQDYLGLRAEYVVQQEQLGTAHALAATEDLLKGCVDHVVVMYGDIPSLKGESLKRMVDEHLDNDAIVTMVTSNLSDFEDWRSAMYSFGRVVRNELGYIVKFVEMKDASKEELDIKEVNVGFYCFRSDWLWEHLPYVGNDNVQKEYYINDLVDMAIVEGHVISSISVDPREAIGVSTKEDLEVVSSLNVGK